MSEADAGHDTGDEDQAHRQHYNWWPLQTKIGRRVLQDSCDMCSTRLIGCEGDGQVREVDGQNEVFLLCDDPSCQRALDAFVAARWRRLFPARIRDAFRRGIEAAQREQAGES